jgi:hypothetical protein
MDEFQDRPVSYGEEKRRGEKRREEKRRASISYRGLAFQILDRPGHVVIPTELPKFPYREA